jgi:hypothetical protein
MESPAQFGEIRSFLKSVSLAKISKISCFRHEDYVKWKSLQYESCWQFFPGAN